MQSYCISICYTTNTTLQMPIAKISFNKTNNEEDVNASGNLVLPVKRSLHFCPEKIFAKLISANFS